MKEKVTPKSSRAGLIIVVLSVVGLLISSYLALDHYDDTEHSFCDFGSHVSCTKVKNSVWAELFNVPVAIFGVGWFLILTMLSVFAEGMNMKGKVNFHANAIFFWALFGTVFVFYLVFAEIVLQTICPMCTVIHVITLVVLYLSWKQYEAQPRKPALVDIIRAMRGWIVGIAVMNLIIIINFNLPSAPTQLGPAPPPVDSAFGRCVADDGWRIWGLSGCGYCERQKALLGSAMDHIEFVDCAVRGKECGTKELKGYPTWIQEADGVEVARWTGYASLKNIEAFSGCSPQFDEDDNIGEQ